MAEPADASHQEPTWASTSKRPHVIVVFRSLWGKQSFLFLAPLYPIILWRGLGGL